MLIQLVLNSCRKTAIQLDSIESKIASHECLALIINVDGWFELVIPETPIVLV